MTSAAASDTAPLPLVERINFLSAALPAALRTTLWHLLGLSRPSQYVDLRTEVVVAIIRALAVPRSWWPPSGLRSITDTQQLLTRDPGVQGPVWISRYTAPVPPEAKAVRDVLVDAVRRLADESEISREGGEDLSGIQWPDVVPVEAEWTGHRGGVGPEATLPVELSEAERYAALMREASAPQPTTVLYLHGGAFWLLDPATHRMVTRTLAKRTSGRCYSVRYRLAPQHPFPAALLDALVSYLALLYPPPGAFHDAVHPQHIVFAGDSAGGNLALALVRLVLDLQRRDIRVLWHGSRRPVPLPAGVAVSSPWIDPTTSSPSWHASSAASRVDFDYLPALEIPGGDGLHRPPCAAWPAVPPRRFLYADAALVAHPLVTLLMGPRDGWRGAPPVYVCLGWEALTDEVRFFVETRLHKQVAAVVFEQYEAMPHCFALVLPFRPQTRRCLDRWAAFVRQAVEAPDTLRAGASSSSFTYIAAKTLEETPIDPGTLSPYAEADIKKNIRARLATIEPNGSVAKL